MNSQAHYLLRFDDVCPTMNWTNWGAIEAALLRLNIQPIMAVVPDNRDPQLVVEKARDDFWDRVRFWQSQGWTIAIHGFEHKYTRNDAGLVPLNNRSEFAGLPGPEQESKLRQGLSVFHREGVSPTVWVAPSHSFDQCTLSVLRGLNINMISDGFLFDPFCDSNGMIWIPQQLWNLRTVRGGVWTVCYHSNSWSPQQVESEIDTFSAYRDQIVSVKTVLATRVRRHRSLADWLFWKWGPISRTSSSRLLRALLHFAFYAHLSSGFKRVVGRFMKSPRLI